LKAFGTDGIRGRYPAPPLDHPTATRLAAALRDRFGGPIAVVRDTRESGPRLRAALALALGGALVDLGVLPTPALSALLADGVAAAGIAITASHNPWRDNGLKVLGPGGHKLTPEVEAALEADLDRAWALPSVAPARRLPGAEARYVELLLGKLPPGRWLGGRVIAVDAAHGAAWRTAPEILRRLGAEVVAIGCAPDGQNINRGVGALHPERLGARVRAIGADAGIALDGDADRCALLGADGAPVHGDALLLLVARPPGLVGTIMCNGALEGALAARGIAFTRAGVGDRQVALEMAARGWSVGGEPSGHVLLGDGFPTGDGLLTALRVLAGGFDLDARLAGFRPFPQVSRALPVRDKPPLEDLPAVTEAVAAARAGGASQLVLRYSGTESLLRIMVEAPTAAVAARLADELSRAAEGALGRFG
jgi:phosphoglucosamine mutase